MPFFEKSQMVAINDGNFIDNSTNITHNHSPANVTSNYASDGSKGSGIKLLLESSLREAIHNSSARDPPKCHPGTRKEYIRDITAWGSGEWKTREARALWMRGPAGAGKSAVAQTCAEDIGRSGRLGATFFFFRPNGWNDPDKFIPTIVYQFTTKYPAYRDLVDAIILRDPLVLETSIDVQFEELLVKPLRELSSNNQDTIVELVMTSIHDRTTPFLWAFFSRPEPHITAAFSSELAEKVSWQLALSVSRDVDSDIEAYLRDGFRIIRAKYGLPRAMAWPSDEDIRQLVDQSSGLFVYAVTIVRYIGQDSASVRPEERLRLVLELSRGASGSDNNPLSKLDHFYLLIMKQIPEAVLQDTLSLLLIRTLSFPGVTPTIPQYCSALGLSLTAFYTATSNLHSVFDIQNSQQGTPLKFLFYHAFFTDFPSDPKRSGPKFCIYTPDIHQRCLKSVTDTLYCISINNTDLLAWSDPEISAEFTRAAVLEYPFSLVANHDVHVEKDILQQLSQIDWKKFQSSYSFYPAGIEEFVAKIPPSWRSKIIRPFRIGPLDVIRQTFFNLKQGKLRSRRKTYIVGTGENKAFLVREKDGGYVLSLYTEIA